MAKQRYRPRRDFGPVVPKPYDFVSLPREIVRTQTIGHEAFKDGVFSGCLEFEIVALSHLYVSAGVYALSEDLQYPAGGVLRGCYRVNGVPAIPGASLKGVVRSVTEAVTASCVGSVSRDVRPFLPRWRGECTPELACPACSMFGVQGRLGKVAFADALLLPGQETSLHRIPSLYRPHLSQREKPLAYFLDPSRRGLKGRKFYFHGRMREEPRNEPVEVIPQGSRLRGSVDFENLTRDELAVLFFALGLDGSFQLKLGGGKPVCLGSLEVHPLRLTLRQPREEFMDYDAAPEVYEGKAAGRFIVGTIREVESQRKYISPEQAQKLRAILRYPNDRECPTGMY